MIAPIYHRHMFFDSLVHFRGGEPKQPLQQEAVPELAIACMRAASAADRQWPSIARLVMRPTRAWEDAYELHGDAEAAIRIVWLVRVPSLEELVVENVTHEASVPIDDTPTGAIQPILEEERPEEDDKEIEEIERITARMDNRIAKRHGLIADRDELEAAREVAFQNRGKHFGPLSALVTSLALIYAARDRKHPDPQAADALSTATGSDPKEITQRLHSPLRSFMIARRMTRLLQLL